MYITYSFLLTCFIRTVHHLLYQVYGGLGMQNLGQSTRDYICSTIIGRYDYELAAADSVYIRNGRVSNFVEQT